MSSYYTLACKVHGLMPDGHSQPNGSNACLAVSWAARTARLLHAAMNAWDGGLAHDPVHGGWNVSQFVNFAAEHWRCCDNAIVLMRNQGGGWEEDVVIRVIDPAEAR